MPTIAASILTEQPELRLEESTAQAERSAWAPGIALTSHQRLLSISSIMRTAGIEAKATITEVKGILGSVHPKVTIAAR